MTISYNRLGSNGRLGNQMFQYAGLRGIAANRGFDWVIPPPENYGDSNYGLFDCFEMSTVEKNNFGFLNAQSIQTGVFHFSEDLFNDCPDNINLHDHFTTQKYFLNIEDTIRKDYTFKNSILEPCKEIISQFKHPIFLHVRRGDYAAHTDAHPLIPIEYYEKALKLFPEDSEVLVFSDSIDWCKEQEFFQGDRFMLSEYSETYPQVADTLFGKQKSKIPYFDLCMMTLCEGGILANSTMSWWGAWLMENKKQPIVAPKPWFGKFYDYYNMNDLLPDDWMEIEYE
jgi:hypothetical protein